MKLSLALAAVVAAKKGNTDKKVKEVRTNPETCQVQFANANAQSHGTVLDAKVTGTSGWIDIHDYPNRANCYIEVVADSSCTEITTKVIHAGIETNNYDGCDSDYDDGYYGGCCQYDRFWWNEEQERSCGCRGNNLSQGDGCNDILAASPTSNQFNYGLDDYPERGYQDRTFIGNTVKFNFASDYRDAQGNLRIEWSCPVPSAPADPIERLDQVYRFSIEVMDTEFFVHKRRQNWRVKYENNYNRLKRQYNKCGSDPNVGPANQWIFYDNSSPRLAMTDVTTGFIKWVDTYLSTCKAQRTSRHQNNRLNKWHNAFLRHASVSHLVY